MIGTSFPEYVFIRVCIFLLQYTTPLCLLGLVVLVAVEGGTALSHPLGIVLVAYSLIDILYAVFVWFPYNRRLEEEAKHPPPLSPTERRVLFHRVQDHVPDIRRYLRIWFLGADEAEIRRDNVREFLLWAFFDRWPGDESEEDEAELDDYIAVIEKQMGQKLEPGRGKAEGLRLTFNEVQTRYRSFVWYLIVGLVDFATHCLLAWQGFEYCAQPNTKLLSVLPLRLQNLFARKQSSSRHLSYWHRPHTAADKLPVVFLHGIGIGLSTYVPYFSSLNLSAKPDEQIGIVAIEILPVSFRLTSPPLSKLEFLDQMTTVVDAHGWDKFVLASHSYGTVLTAHMLQSASMSPRIASVVMIDPVSILLHLPDVAYNFTRRKPRRANEWQLWYFASMDPGVAHCLGRHFFWKDNITWKEDLVEVAGESPADSGGVDDGIRSVKQRRRAAVCLSERDLIVDTPTVAQYIAGGDDWMLPNAGFLDQADQGGPDRGHLTSDGIEMYWFPGLDHAQVFDVKDSRERVCSITRRYCARSAGSEQ